MELTQPYVQNWLKANPQATTFEFPKGVTSIGCNTFRDCIVLTSIMIPKGVTSIGERAFDGCRGLTSIVISEGVTSISSHAFYGCIQLSYIIAPAHLHKQLNREYPNKKLMTLQQVENSLVEKLIRHTPVNNNQEARSEEVKSIITSMSPLAKASLFNYPMSANSYWKDLNGKQTAVALGDAPAHLLELIGCRQLNSFSMNDQVITNVIDRYLSIKDKLNLAMVAKQIDLIAAPLNPNQDTTDVDHKDAISSAEYTDQVSIEAPSEGINSLRI